MMGCGAEAAKMKGKRALQGWPSNPSLPKRLTSGQKLEEVAAAASVTIPDEIGTALDGDSQSQEVPCAIGLEACQPAPCRGTSPQRLSEEELAAAFEGVHFTPMETDMIDASPTENIALARPSSTGLEARIVGCHKRCYRAVSYTHLTLPTIYSV